MGSTRDHILQAAVELFSEQGYESTTVRDLCRHADANVAAVNYHFKGKSGLGVAVVDYLFENVGDTKSSLLDVEQVSKESDWKSAIRRFIYNFIVDRDIEEHRNFYRSRLIFRELNNPSTLFKDMYSKYIGPLQQQLKVLIKQGLPEGVEDKVVSMWVITLMSQCVMFRKKQIAPMDIEPIDFSDSGNIDMVVDHIANTLFSGLEFQKKRDAVTDAVSVSERGTVAVN